MKGWFFPPSHAILTGPPPRFASKGIRDRVSDGLNGFGVKVRPAVAAEVWDIPLSRVWIILSRNVSWQAVHGAAELRLGARLALELWLKLSDVRRCLLQPHFELVM
jgi:hypothetical protein